MNVTAKDIVLNSEIAHSQCYPLPLASANGIKIGNATRPRKNVVQGINLFSDGMKRSLKCSFIRDNL
jgi:hypothetical protein